MSSSLSKRQRTINDDANTTLAISKILKEESYPHETYQLAKIFQTCITNKLQFTPDEEKNLRISIARTRQAIFHHFGQWFISVKVVSRDGAMSKIDIEYKEDRKEHYERKDFSVGMVKLKSPLSRPMLPSHLDVEMDNQASILRALGADLRMFLKHTVINSKWESMMNGDKTTVKQWQDILEIILKYDPNPKTIEENGHLYPFYIQTLLYFLKTKGIVGMYKYIGGGRMVHPYRSLHDHQEKLFTLMHMKRKIPDVIGTLIKGFLF